MMALLFTGLFAVPILATLAYTTTRANLFGASIMFAVVLAGLLVGGESGRKVEVRFSRTHAVFTALVLVVVAGWSLQGIEFWAAEKTWTLLGALLLYLVFVRVFTRQGEIAGLIGSLKLLAVAATSLFFVAYINLPVFDSGPSIKEFPPVFGHLRHFNYELYFAILLSVYGLLSGRRSVMLTALLFLLIYLSVWSGGRGNGLAVATSIGFLLIFSRHLRIWRLSAVLACFAVVAAVIVFASGIQYLLVDTVQVTVSSSAAKMTSGRTNIWLDSINTVVSGGPLAVFTGLGPGAFREYGIRPGYLHPHNSLLQAFMEFGLIGLGVFIGMLMRFGWLSIQLVRATKDPLAHLAAAMFWGGVVFSMVDGIFHHVLPLTMMVFIMAYLRSLASLLPPAGGRRLRSTA